MAKVDINTKMITLLGDPLKQSFAAQMQNCGYEAAGLNMIYFYTEVNNEHLADVVNGIRYMNFAGFAVTKPNKVKVLEYLDELDPLCEKMGASNTVVKTPEGKLVGYNTDGIGFIRYMEEMEMLRLMRIFTSVSVVVEQVVLCVQHLLTTAQRKSTSQMYLKNPVRL